MSSERNQKTLKFTELDQFTIDERSVQLLNYKFCTKNSCVVLDVVDPNSLDPVTVGMLDPKETELIELLKKILSRPISPVRLNSYEIQKALDIGHSKEELYQDKFKLSLQPTHQISFDPTYPASRLINELLGRAITLKASDVHIECYENDVDVRIRIDGILHQMSTPINNDNITGVISRLKILSDLDIAEKRAAQDGRVYASYQVDGQARSIDFRLSIVPGPFGEDAVLRILDSEKPLIGLERLGFSKEVLEQYRMIVNNPEGLILVTGPTGSGKTTTLYSALQEINTTENKVLTAEDPIEYLFAKINQKQVGPSMSFADYARTFLRQDPDIMMIGEIRDEETADMTLRAAQTGHLVLTTLHTNDSVATVPRLRTLGMGSGLIADCLLGSLSQRLVRRVCKDCKTDAEADGYAQEIFRRLGQSFPLVHGRGCERCRNTGYCGRIGIYELFVVNQEAADLISAETPGHEIRQFAREQGMRSLFDDAIEKVKEGITTFSELRRTVPYRIITEPLADCWVKD